MISFNAFECKTLELPFSVVAIYFQISFLLVQSRQFPQAHHAVIHWLREILSSIHCGGMWAHTWKYESISQDISFNKAYPTIMPINKHQILYIISIARIPKMSFRSYSIKLFL